MKGTLQRLPDGTLAATLRDKWGFTFSLTGTKADAGYDIEVKLVGVPESLALPGDEAFFEVGG